jgi:hypothetical protein
LRFFWCSGFSAILVIVATHRVHAYQIVPADFIRAIQRSSCIMDDPSALAWLDKALADFSVTDRRCDVQRCNFADEWQSRHSQIGAATRNTSADQWHTRFPLSHPGSQAAGLSPGPAASSRHRGVATNFQTHKKTSVAAELATTLRLERKAPRRHPRGGWLGRHCRRSRMFWSLRTTRAPGSWPSCRTDVLAFIAICQILPGFIRSGSRSPLCDVANVAEWEMTVCDDKRTRSGTCWEAVSCTWSTCALVHVSRHGDRAAHRAPASVVAPLVMAASKPRQWTIRSRL